MGPFQRSKNSDKPLIRQILDLIPNFILQSAISRFGSDKYCSKYKTKDQLVALTFGQLNKCLTLSDISTGMGASLTFIKVMGLSQSPARSTMSDGNKQRNWKVFESIYHSLLSYNKSSLRKHHREFVIEEIKKHPIKIIDSTTISLCLNLFDWAKFRTAKGGIKIHTCWDDSLQIPDIINITYAKVSDRSGLENNVFAKGTIVIEDKGYFDFKLMLSRIMAENIFVTRIKDNTVYEVLETRVLPKEETYILKDEVIVLTSDTARKAGMKDQKLRRIEVFDPKSENIIEILTNQLVWTAATIAALYKRRWDIELFFKAIKQNLQIKTFTGTSENAVKSQVYVALICYLLLEVIRRTKCKQSQAFSNFVEKIRICLTYYCSLDYVCNNIKEGAHKIKPKNKGSSGQSPLFEKEQTDLFSG